MTDLITVAPDQIPIAVSLPDDARVLFWTPAGPLQGIKTRKLLSKLTSADLYKATRALLFADLAWAENSIAVVFDDPTAAYNGIYRKTGISGAGGWTQIEQLIMAVRNEVLDARDQAVAAADSVLAVLPGASVGKASDGVQFDDARGETFTARWTAPVDATLTVADGSITFNSVGAAKNLAVKLKNYAGTGDFRGCFEDNWEIDTTHTLLAAYGAPGINSFRVGFVDGVGRFYGARVQSHPGTATQLFAGLEVAGNSVDTIPAGYTYSVGDTIRVRAKRNGNFISITLNWNGGADITVTSAAMVPVDASTVERPRLFSIPQVIYLQGNVRTDSVRISHGGANPKLAIAGTSLADGRFTATYGASYSQLIKAAHPGDVMVCAAPSATSANWKDVLPELLAAGPAEILFEIFANDMALAMPTGTTLATIQANVAAIVAMCDAVGVKARFLNCPPHNFHAGTINTWLATSGYAVFDIFTILVAAGGTGFNLNDAYESDTPIAGIAVAPDDLHWGTAGNLAVFTPANAWLVGLGTFLRERFRVIKTITGGTGSDSNVPNETAVKGYLDDALVSRAAPHALFPVAAGSFLTAAVNGGSLITGTPPAGAASIEFVPFIPARDITVDRLDIEVTAAVAASSAHLGIYADDGSGAPGALLDETVAALDTSSIGVKNSGTDIGPLTLEAGVLYWLAFHPSHAITTRQLGPAQLALIHNAGSNNFTWAKATQAFGSLPDPAPAVSYPGVNGAAATAVRLRTA